MAVQSVVAVDATSVVLLVADVREHGAPVVLERRHLPVPPPSAPESLRWSNADLLRRLRVLTWVAQSMDAEQISVVFIDKPRGEDFPGVVSDRIGCRVLELASDDLPALMLHVADELPGVEGLEGAAVLMIGPAALTLAARRHDDREIAPRSGLVAVRADDELASAKVPLGSVTLAHGRSLSDPVEIERLSRIGQALLDPIAPAFAGRHVMAVAGIDVPLLSEYIREHIKPMPRTPELPREVTLETLRAVLAHYPMSSRAPSDESAARAVTAAVILSAVMRTFGQQALRTTLVDLDLPMLLLAADQVGQLDA